MQRKLGKFERAAAFTGERAIFNLVGVLRLESLPSPEIIRQALRRLQIRHPILRVCLAQESNPPFFKPDPEADIPLSILERESDNHWLETVEQELNHKFDPAVAPLIRCAVLTDGNGPGEIILCAQHAILDGASLEHLFHQIMGACRQIETGDSTNDLESLAPLPPVEDRFPAGFRAFDLQRKSFGYLLRQMGDEVQYQLALRGKRRPPIHPTARGRVIAFRTPEAATSELTERARKKRVTLNSVLNAAALLGARKVLYGGGEMPHRYMTWADLRPYVEPPPPEDHLTCYISPLRYTIQLRPEDDLWSVAARINHQIYQSFQRGEKFLAAVMAESFMRLTFGLKKFRMCTTALSYTGESRLKRVYGNWKVAGVHGFVSNFGLGPEFSGRVGLYDGQLQWDMLYLDADMDEAKAATIAHEIQEIIKKQE